MDSSAIISNISPNGASLNNKENQSSGEDGSQGLSIIDTLSKNIIQQCEFYFSDCNILKDQFLLNLVKASTEGWVDLNIIENFRKMKQLSEDHNIVRQALLKSAKLELSEDGLRIRRRDPLPEWDSSVYNRSLIISDFPENVDPTIELVTKFFEEKLCSPCLVRVLLPGRRIPPDLKRSSARSIIGVKPCAIVEFDDHSKATKAVEIVQKNWSNSFARLLSAKIKNPNGTKPQKPQPKDKKTSPPERRPLIFHGLESNSNQSKVIHIREPLGPPSEHSLGFPAGWREQMYLEKLSLEVPQITQESNAINLAHMMLNDPAIVPIMTSNPVSTPNTS